MVFIKSLLLSSVAHKSTIKHVIPLKRPNRSIVMYTETMTHKITHRVCGTKSSFDVVDERLDIYSGLWGIRFRVRNEEKINCVRQKK